MFIIEYTYNQDIHPGTECFTARRKGKEGVLYVKTAEAALYLFPAAG